jgi:hypothetical protein
MTLAYPEPKKAVTGPLFAHDSAPAAADSSYCWQHGVKMDQGQVQTLAQVFAAIGTVAVAILAIWGEKVRALVAGPKLRLSLRDSRGNLTVRANGRRTVYYHILVRNERTWSPATSVRITVTSIEKRRPDGTYFLETVVAPLQLTWAYAEVHELLPTIVESDTCDLGFLDEDANRFTLPLYVTPNNFRGYVGPNEAMRVHIVGSGYNVSTDPLVLQVSWDGVWSSDMDELQRHLVIQEVSF